MFQFFRVVFYVSIAWFLVSTIVSVHWILLFVATFTAATNVGVIYMLQHYQPELLKFCRNPYSRTYVEWIGYFTGQHHSLDGFENRRPSVKLHSANDFEFASRRAKQAVRGHDDVIDSILSRLHENLSLKKSRKNTNRNGPLASFLLVGREGIGKRYLSRVVAKLLYGSASVEVYHCEQLTKEFLMGTQVQQGKLFEIIHRTPCALVLFENIERADAGVAIALIDLLTTGNLIPPGLAKPVSFQDATIVLTTSQFSDLNRRRSCEKYEQLNSQSKIDLVKSEIQVDPRIAEAVTEVCLLAHPSDLVKAEVVAIQMQKECRDHGVTLSNIAPEILATQVLQITEDEGFQFMPQRVKKLVRKPLMEATSHRAALLSLRIQPQATA